MRLAFSIIIPVYNVEPYLPACMESVIPVLEDADEIILSLGKSTDRSGESARRYAEEYPGVKLTVQDGTGLSNARNCALRQAKGDFVLFVDSDDFVDTETLKSLLGKIRGGVYRADVVMTDFYRYYETTGKSQLTSQIGSRELVGLDSLPLIAAKRQSFWNVWRSVYRKAFLEKHQLYFRESAHAEDVDFTTRLFLSEPDILFVNAPYYYYRFGREGSLMNSVRYSRVADTVSALSEAVWRLRSCESGWSKVIMSRFQFEYILSMALAQEVPPQEREAALRLFDDYRRILSPTEDLAVAAVRRFLQIAGTGIASRLLLLAKAVKRKREHRTL